MKPVNYFISFMLLKVFKIFGGVINSFIMIGMKLDGLNKLSLLRIFIVNFLRLDCLFLAIVDIFDD
jgi:hypothetical protein